jgi:hypothetical protein
MLIVLLCLQQSLQPRIFVQPQLRHMASLEALNPATCVANFRFRLVDLKQLYRLCEFPELVAIGHPQHRFVCRGEEVFLVVLRRLSTPIRLQDMVLEFGLFLSELSEAFNWGLRFISSKFQCLLSDMSLWADNVPVLKQAFVRKGFPVQLPCIGILDATLRPTCKPTTGQQAVYSGKHKSHGLKFELVVLPNGLTSWLFGPVEGRRHDCFVLNMGGLKNNLDGLNETCVMTYGSEICVIADKGYAIHKFIQTPYKGSNLDEQQLAFNDLVNSVRMCVEWNFSKITTYFAQLDFFRNQKILLSSIGTMYICAAFFSNCHTCFYGSETSAFFDCMPPTIEEYLSKANQ